MSRMPLVLGGVAASAAGVLGARRLLRRSRGGGHHDHGHHDHGHGHGHDHAGGPALRSVPVAATWTCDCGTEYRVAGTGRHRVVWPADGTEADAILSADCPVCGRPLAA